MRGDFHGKVLILSVSDTEDGIIEKVLEVLGGAPSMEYIQVSNEPTLCFGNLEIRPEQRMIFLNGIEIALTTREFDVLYFMARRPGQVFTMKQLYESTVQEPYCDSYHTVMSAIYRIRKKIGKRYIINVHGYGYKFDGNA